MTDMDTERHVTGNLNEKIYQKMGRYTVRRRHKKGWQRVVTAMAAIVVWATAAWYFGIPTSESHALIAGISGAAVAIQNSFAGINGAEWVKVLWGILLSTVLGFVLGFLTSKLTVLIFRNQNRMKSERFFSRAQVVGGGAMAFMHGAQDGQKFMAIFLLGAAFANGNSTTSEFAVPIWLMVLCSLVMGLGTSIGGYRIIKSVGMDMVKLKPYQGFSADLAATLCLLLSSLTGPSAPPTPKPPPSWAWAPPAA